MEIILTAAFAALFFYIIRKNKFFIAEGFPAWLPASFFLLKCVSGIFLGMIYTMYYTNHNDTDTFKFFTDSKIMFDSLFTKPEDFVRMLTGIDSRAPELRHYYEQMNSWLNTNLIFNDNKTIIRFNAFLRFFSLGYYNVHVVFINFISFTGLFCLYKAFASICPEKKRELLIFTFLMPSVLFWGSGLLKDGLLISGFGLLMYSFIRLLYFGLTLKRIIVLILSVALMIMTKTYVFAIILPGLFAWWISKKLSSKKVILTFLTVYSLYFFTAFNLYRIHPDYNVAALLYYKQKNFIDMGRIHHATMISIPRLECSPESIIINSPRAFFNTLLRPFITDIHGKPLILLSALENILIIILIIACLASFSNGRQKLHPAVLFCIIFTTLLFVLIGLISPILGAMVRYRIVAIPCLLFVLTYFYDREKLLRRLSFFSNTRRKEGT